MIRIMLIIAYDGTNYCGWQKQPNGITIEEVLNNALKDLLKEDIEVIGASRTDSGVHALGNVAVFDTETKITPEKIAYALNVRLPDDIRIQSSKEVDINFHPRHCNSIKTYEYKIFNRSINMPMHRLYTNFVYNKLDVNKMQKAATYLIGEHDFKAFCSVRTSAKSTIRRLYSICIEKNDEDIITITLKGNGFLYNMVRIIVGTLIVIGKSKMPPEKMKEILESKDRTNASPTALARGLCLVGIDFEYENI